jgi:acyl-ACP thioesterase
VFAERIWYFDVVEVREEKITIRTYECGVGGTVKIASLMQLMQEAAALHAEQLGFGREKMNELDGYWVLSNVRVEFVELPKWKEQVTIRTWPSGYTRLIASREFIGTDRDGRELFRAGSEWMVLDKQRGRPKNLFHLDLALSKTGTKALQEKLSRLEPRQDGIVVDRVRVARSAIDLNGHVNNTEYIRWGIDALSRQFKLSSEIRCIQATYLSEVFEAEELDLLVSCGPGGRFQVLARKAGAQTDVFVMDVTC